MGANLWVEVKNNAVGLKMGNIGLDASSQEVLKK
jgi:hypothetical protein